MSSEAATFAPPLRGARRKLRLEHVVMGGAVLALVVLVVLPLVWLLIGSVRGEEGLSLDHFAEVLSGRLYVTALKNSLTLGAWTGLASTIIGLTLAWAVARWIEPKVDAVARRRVAHARQQARAALAFELSRPLAPALTAIAGLPSSRQATFRHEQLSAALAA